MNIGRLKTQFQREFWENRGSFLILPLAIAAFYALLMGGGFLLFEVVDVNVQTHVEREAGGNVDIETQHIEGVSGSVFIAEHLARLEAMAPAVRAERVTFALFALSLPFTYTALLVAFFYLLDSLHSERRDRSILFWKSMPVSDTTTVLTKLVTGAWLVPAVYLAVALLTQVVALLVGGLVALVHDHSALELIWGPARLWSLWSTTILTLVAEGFWALPLLGWVLVVSAAARSSLFMWVIGVPAVAWLLEKMFLGDAWLAAWFVGHVRPLTSVNGTEGLLDKVLSVDALVGVVVGAALVAVAIWLRGRTDEI